MKDELLLEQLSPSIRHLVESHDRLAHKMAEDFYLGHASRSEISEFDASAISNQCAQVVRDAWKEQPASPELVRLVSERMAFKFYQRLRELASLPPSSQSTN